MAVLDEGLYDDEFVAPFQLSTAQQASFNLVEEAQNVNEIENQENIQIHSTNAVLFSKQQPINDRNSHARATHGSPSNRCSPGTQAPYAKFDEVEFANPAATSRPSPGNGNVIQEPIDWQQSSSSRNSSDERESLAPILRAIEEFRSRYEYPRHSRNPSVQSTPAKPNAKRVSASSQPGKKPFHSLDSEDDFRSGCRNVSHQQQFFSELPSPGRSHNTN